MGLPLRNQLFSQSMLFSGLLLFFIGGYLTIFLFRQEIHTTHNLIQERNHSITLFLEGYFNEISNTVKFLATDINVQNGDLNNQIYRDKALQIYQQIQNSNENIFYVYSGYKDGTLLINDYAAPKDYVLTKRPWYIAAKASAPTLSIGEPYQEAVYQTWLIATSKALERNGSIYGVISIDCSMDNILHTLKQDTDVDHSFDNFVLNQEGKIIIHPNQELLGKTLHEVFSEDINLAGLQGYLKTADNESALFYSTLKTNGWTIITVANIKDIEGPIVRYILACLTTVAFFCLLWGYAQSVALSKRIAEPLEALRRQVNNIIGGQPEENYSYPDNDIGHLAHEVESLISGEIYAAHAEVVKVNCELRRANKALEKEQQHLELLANTDPLTGIYNRYKIDKCLEEEWKRSKRYSTIFSVIIIDIDKFKDINDTYGHQAGDLVLRSFSKIISKNIRDCDSAGRWGGEEFLVILPETDLQQATLVADKLRDIVENYLFSVERRVTFSAGLGQFDHTHDLDELLTTIDKRLYFAKENGRNMVVSKELEE